MANNLDMKEVVKHIVNGTFEDNLCRICLLPLTGIYESIFTMICKEDKDYCIADVIKQICNIRISCNNQHKICSDCFMAASTAYKFYLSAKRTEEILNYYVNILEQYTKPIEIPKDIELQPLCITLPLFEPKTKSFDYDLTGLCINGDQQYELKDFDQIDSKNNEQSILEVKLEEEAQKDDENDNVIVISYENGVQKFFKAQEDGTLISIGDDQKRKINELFTNSLVTNNGIKKKRRRNPMMYKMCSKCPVQYRFFGKLKEHMKIEHDIDIFICMVCKEIIEGEQEFNNHLKTHTNIHSCPICNIVFKKRESIEAHTKWHEEMENMKKDDSAHMCEICGLVMKDEEQLKDHCEKKHVKNYTCYYCGKMYKGEISFEMHIKKHEVHMGNGDTEQDVSEVKKGKRKFMCADCPRDFVDERALMWHRRLHTNERPYICDVCGRGFVSLNRRNQHVVCTHTAPTRRCPLCPALFHLRSMVNTHIKKVHLKAHKRRNRTSKHQNVFSRTEPVPIQELSVSIQSKILEIQVAQKDLLNENE